MTNGKTRFDLQKITELALEGDTNQANRMAMVKHLLAKHNGNIKGGWVKVGEGKVGDLPEWLRPKCRPTLSFGPDGTAEYFTARPRIKTDEGGKYGSGLLLYQDAVEVVQEAEGKGLNPLSDYSLWYIGGSLVKAIDYKITIGVAELKLGEGFTLRIFDMTLDELEKAGIDEPATGKIAYLIPQSHMAIYSQLLVTCLQRSDFDQKSAQRFAAENAARGSGIGIFTDEEKGQKKQHPTGRTWDFFAEKRAITDAINKSVGTIPPNYFIKWLEQDRERTVIKPSDYTTLAALPDNLPNDLQARYIEQDRRVEALQSTDWDEGLFILGEDGPVTLQEKAEKNVRDLRGDKAEQEGID